MRLLHSKDPCGNGKRIFIAVPAYGNLPAEFVSSLWDARKELLDNGILSELLIAAGGCHVDDNRNMLISTFLESQCDALVFIDDDTRFNACDLVALALSTPDVVAGIAPKKKEDLDFACRLIPGEIWSNSECLIEVEGVGAAFLKISRYAIEELCKNEVSYTQKIGGTDRVIYQIFERTTENGARWGGDYSFCRKWSALGGKIYVFPDMTFGHIGHKEYLGSLGHWLREKNGLNDEYLSKKLREFRGVEIPAKEILSISQAWGNSNYSASIDLLSALDVLAKSGSGPILEFGSGLSTLVMSTSGREVFSVDHDMEWIDKVNSIASKAGLHVSTMYSDIKKDCYESVYSPYPSMVFIDGPPRHLAKREKVIDLIPEPLPGCVFVVDDSQDSVVTDEVYKKFGVEFNSFGRFSIGKYEGIK